MERFNEVRFMGNIGTLQVGDRHTYMAIAINESYKAKDQTEWTDKTTWVDVVAFGPVRDKITKQDISKGDGVLIMGKLDSSEYEGKRRTQIVASKVQLVQKPARKQQEVSAPTNTVDVSTEATPEVAATTSDEDLPF